jgi:hypothetical protein
MRRVGRDEAVHLPTVDLPGDQALTRLQRLRFLAVQRERPDAAALGLVQHDQLAGTGGNAVRPWEGAEVVVEGTVALHQEDEVPDGRGGMDRRVLRAGRCAGSQREGQREDSDDGLPHAARTS